MLRPPDRIERTGILRTGCKVSERNTNAKFPQPELPEVEIHPSHHSVNQRLSRHELPHFPASDAGSCNALPMFESKRRFQERCFLSCKHPHKARSRCISQHQSPSTTYDRKDHIRSELTSSGQQELQPSTARRHTGLLHRLTIFLPIQAAGVLQSSLKLQRGMRNVAFKTGLSFKMIGQFDLW
jgi:hypothetical protein